MLEEKDTDNVEVDENFVKEIINESVIRVVKGKDGRVEFDVAIEGAEELEANTVVRFIIQVNKEFCILLHASHDEGDKWYVNVPDTPALGAGDYKIAVEVIIDNYHFEPAKGKLQILNEPKVELDKSKIDEVSSVNGGQPHPNNALLFPEFEPKSIKKSTVPQKTPEDEQIEIEKIASSVTPGAGKSYPEFDGKKAAQKAIMNVLGTNAPPSLKISTASERKEGTLLRPKAVDPKIVERDKKVREALEALKKK